MHWDRGSVLCLCISLHRFIPLYQECEKSNEGEILWPVKLKNTRNVAGIIEAD